MIPPVHRTPECSLLPTTDMPGIQKRRRASDYVRYIQLVRDEVSAGRTLSRSSKTVLNALVLDQLERIGREAGKLAQSRNRITVGRREVATAIRMLFPRALQVTSHTEGERACSAYTASVAADA